MLRLSSSTHSLAMAWLEQWAVLPSSLMRGTSTLILCFSLMPREPKILIRLTGGEEAREQALDYYQLLLNLRQSILNLLAAGLYHLYEQHRETVIDLLKQDRRTLPPLQNLTGWTKVEELRLLANTVKPPGSVLAQACVRVVRCHEAGWELVARVPSALGHGAKGVTGEGWGGRGRLEGRHHPHQLLPATG
jgi:hypothetical protein